MIDGRSKSRELLRVREGVEDLYGDRVISVLIPQQFVV